MTRSIEVRKVSQFVIEEALRIGVIITEITATTNPGFIRISFRGPINCVAKFEKLLNDH